MNAGLDPSIGVFITAFGGVAAAIGTFYAGHRRGSDRTKQQLSTHYDKEQVKIHFRTKIQWIEERKSDLNEKINLRGTSTQEQDIYRKLIEELDIQKKELERSRDSLVD